VKRLSRIFWWVLLAELVLAFAFGTRIRTRFEHPVTYLGLSVPAQPLDVG